MSTELPLYSLNLVCDDSMGSLDSVNSPNTTTSKIPGWDTAYKHFFLSMALQSQSKSQLTVHLQKAGLQLTVYPPKTAFINDEFSLSLFD